MILREIREALLRTVRRRETPALIEPATRYGVTRAEWAEVQDVLRPRFERRSGDNGPFWAAWLDLWGFVGLGATREEAGKKVLEMVQLIAWTRLWRDLGLCCRHAAERHMFEGFHAGLEEYVCLDCLETAAQNIEPTASRLRAASYHEYHGEVNA